MPSAFFEAVLGNLAVAAALAAVAFAIGRRATRPALTHALWLLVLAKLVTPPLVVIPIPCLPADSMGMVRPDPPPALLESSPAAFVEPASTAPVAVAAEPVAASAVNQAAPIPSERPAPAQPAWVGWRPTTVEVMLALWAAGTAFAVGRVVLRARRFARLLAFARPAPAGLLEEADAAARRIALRRMPRVRVVPGGIAPFVWAIGRPTLFLPLDLMARLNAEQRLTILAHELAHLRRWDHLVRFIEFTAGAVYWWCPLAWLARSELRRLEEEACDAEVLRAAPESSYDYASAILATIDYLAGATVTPALASGIGEAASLRRRLTLILDAAPPAPSSSFVRLVLLAAALGLLGSVPKLAPLSARNPEPEEAETVPISVPLLGAAAVTGDRTESLQFLPTPIPLLSAVSSVAASALSPDGSRLAIASGRSVLVWELGTRRVVATLGGHEADVTSVAYSPDGSRIATASADSTAAIWDAADGRRLHVLAGHGRWVRSVAFSPDGRTIATAGYDKMVRLWNAATGTPKAAWAGHTAGVRSIAFSPDGRLAASGGADNEVRLWNAARGVAIRTWKHEAAVSVVAFSPDGTLLASGSEDRSVRLWQVGSGREAAPLVPLPDSVSALVFSRRGSGLLAGTNGGHLLLIDPRDGQVRGYLGREPGRPADRPAHAAGIVSILASPDEKAILTLSQDGVSSAWVAAPPQPARLVFRTEHRMAAVGLSPEGATLATGGDDGVIRIWDAGTARELKRLPGHPGGVRSLVFGANGRLVSAGADERVRIWDTATGHAIYTAVQPTADLRIAMAADGCSLAIGGRKMPGVKLLNVNTGAAPRRIGDEFGEVTALAFAPRGDRIATGYSDGFVRIWDVASGSEVVRGRPDTGVVHGISFDATGAVAAIVVNTAPRLEAEEESGPRYAVHFLDTRDGSAAGNLRPLAHPGPIAVAAFATAGRVVTAAHDGNLYLWDPQAGRVVRVIRGHRDAVRGLALAPDRSAAYSAGARAAKMWPMNDN